MRLGRFINILGPGLLYAGAAVGVSHLVQSTRAGADFGFYLVGILLLANVIKYPFFEFGPRYAIATGNNLIDGYGKLGKWALWLFGLLTIGTMFAVQAAVTAVTAGILGFILNINLPPNTLFIIVIISGVLLLLAGRYNIIDRTIKIVIVLLAISTIIAVVMGFIKGYNPDLRQVQAFSWAKPAHIFFLIAFIGWMPAPIDLSVWHSLWSQAKQRNTRNSIRLNQALLDFNIGYIGTTILALSFLSLGAIVMYGSGASLSPNGAVFADQLIGMYSDSLGRWAFPIISIAALATMISTTLTCLDAYPRIAQAMSKNLFKPGKGPTSRRMIYRFTLILVSGGSIVLYVLLADSMHFMVDMATTLSFITAPILAVLNHKVIHSAEVPQSARPKAWLKIYSYAGIILLAVFTFVYIIWNFIH